MYSKVFRSILDGSLANDYDARHVFQDLLILADREGDVVMSLSAISRTLNYPHSLDTLRAKMAGLGSPDPESKSQAEEGRRIVPILEGRGDNSGWHIVNYAAYRDIRSQEEQREKWRQTKRKQRAQDAEAPCPTLSTNVLPSDTDTDTYTDTINTTASSDAPKPRLSDSQWEVIKAIYPKRRGGQKWPSAKQRAKKHVATGRATYESLIAGTEAYAENCISLNTVGTEFVQQAATFFGPQQNFADEYRVGTAGKASAPSQTAGQRVRSQIQEARL